MKKLNHPNVLPILGVCLGSKHKSGLPFMILPFMINGDLKSYLKKNRKNNACVPKVCVIINLLTEYERVGCGNYHVRSFPKTFKGSIELHCRTKIQG